MPYNTVSVATAESILKRNSFHTQIRMLGASGRIAAISGEVGYRKLMEQLAIDNTGGVLPELAHVKYLHWRQRVATSNLKLLQKFIGMLVKLIEDEDGVVLVSDCCGAPVEEHRPEHTHARCTACGEMAVIDSLGTGEIHPQWK